MPSRSFARIAAAAAFFAIHGISFASASPDSVRIRILNEESSALWYSDPARAGEIAAEALSLARSIDDLAGEAAALRNLGVSSDVRGEYAAALVWYDEALSVALSRGDRKMEGAIMNNVGLTNWHLGRVEEATHSYLKAVAILRDTGPPSRLASVYNNLGLIYSDLNRANDAIAFHQKAYDVRTSIGDSLGIGASLHNVALALETQGLDSLAMRYYAQSRSMKEAIGDAFGLGATLNNMGGIYRRWGRLDLALEHYDGAVRVRERIGDQNGLVSSYNNIALVHNDMGDHDEAIRAANHALELALSSEFLVREYHIYGTLREAYLARGDFRRAFEYTEKFYTIRDSLFSQERQQKILELQEQYESEKKLREIEEQRRRISDQELTIQQNRLLQSGLGAGLLLLIAFGFLWQSRVRQRELEYRVGNLETERRIRVERERISRELHDNVGAQLVNVISGIDLAGKYGERDRADDAARVMAAIKAEAQTIVTQLRDTIWTLQSNAITLDAFAEHVDAYVRRAEDMTDLRISWTITEDGTYVMTPTQAMNAFRIIQEAIQNTIKHGGATSSSVDLTVKEERAVLVISDDGTHKVPDDDGAGGSGLKNMRERTEEIGGGFELRTQAGTELTIRFPISRE